MQREAQSQVTLVPLPLLGGIASKYCTAKSIIRRPQRACYEKLSMKATGQPRSEFNASS